jgi:hypothetical protein
MRRSTERNGTGSPVVTGAAGTVVAVEDLQMVRLVTAGSSFEAQVIAARLGADGIVWQLRSHHGGPYPLGSVEVLVSEDDYDIARQLLLADDVESAFLD